MTKNESLETPDLRWRGIYRAGGYAVIGMLVIMAAQIIIFSVCPPPDTVEGFFNLFQQNWLLGLLSMDLLYLLNNTVIVLIYLALFFSLRRENEAAMLIGLVLALVGVTAYYASNTCFEMLSLSGQYTAADSEAQRTALLRAGHAMLAVYKGTAFDSYYILNGIALLIFAVVILRSKVFSKATGYWALAAGILMAIPSTAGMVGMVFSLLSLVPWAVFAILAARRFFRFAVGN